MASVERARHRHRVIPAMRHALVLLTALSLTVSVGAAERIPVTVDSTTAGVGVTFGVPFKKSALTSPDHVRVLSGSGVEIPSQVTEVVTWEPASPSIQWVWVAFITDGSKTYDIEFGAEVRRRAAVPDSLRIIDSQRPAGFIDVDTGALRFRIPRGDGGFIESAELKTGAAPIPLVRESGGRSSFLDLVDDQGPDRSRAVVTHTAIEKGSGPIHAIIRVEGEYRYARSDNRPAPFVTRIHVWAGKPWIRVLHTFVYTGVPDKSRAALAGDDAGQHAHVATRGSKVRVEDLKDEGFTQPNDQIASAGLTLNLAFTPKETRTATRAGDWWQPREEHIWQAPIGDSAVTLLQNGPQPNRMPPVPESKGATRIGGFEATVSGSSRRDAVASGWFEVTGDSARVTVAVKDILEEYPKAVSLDPARRALTTSIWPQEAGPMSFARYSMKPENEDGVQTLESGATGLAKTTEVAFVFSRAPGVSASREAMDLTRPPTVVVPPRIYSASGVFGDIAPHTNVAPELERALDSKFDWWLFNQQFVPWYGMWDYGDGKLNFDPETNEWDIWSGNEPAQDLQLWLHFVRTGDTRFSRAARALSRHTMDVDNIHWPAPPVFRGDTNTSSDYWKYEIELTKNPGSPYVGLGRRHGAQHWLKTLSAHVWVAGWLADYYITGDHRALDMAKQTGEMYLRRIFGEHDMTGRRLYLAAWNLAEVWNATKDPRFKRELDERVERMLRLQREQGGSLVVDRYGYSHNYAIRAFQKIRTLLPPKSRATAEAETIGVSRDLVEKSLIEHARFVRDVVPMNHQMESYLSSLGALVAGYELTKDRSMRAEIQKRLDLMAMMPIATPADPSQAAWAAAVESATHLPKDPDRPKERALWAVTNGLRVFGWTHAFTLPYALKILEDEAAQTPKPAPRR